MPMYRFTGKVPMRYGARKVSAGDRIELPAAPNHLFVLVDAPVAIPIAAKPDSLTEEENPRSRKSKKEI